MKSVDIRDLRDRLEEWIRFAASGETILITDQDEVIAELGPRSEGRPVQLPDAMLADWERRGLYTPAKNPGRIPSPGEAVMTGDELMRALDEDREDR
jgi:antitoxin (DNA-binding transcriptional repressor) of toxin-antitoxin stability system